MSDSEGEQVAVIAQDAAAPANVIPVAVAPAPAVAPEMPITMPYIPGAEWLPQYSGESHTLSDFRERLHSLFRVYPLTESQKVGILMGQLTGAAQHEVKSWPGTDKGTATQILAKLKSTFDTRTAAEIKMRFFGCKQRATDSIRDYALNLQEALRAIKQVDPESVREEDKLLTEQFIEGLLSDAHRTQLRIMVLQNPALDFAKFKDQAIRVLRESTPNDTVPLRPLAITYPGVVPATRAAAGAEAQTLDKDPTAELRQQVQELTKTVAALAKTVQSLQVTPSPARIELASSPDDVPWMRQRRIPPTRGKDTDRYDSTGQPICRRCSQAGHIARHCPLNGPSLGPGANPQV
ncbi:uncharacterized protein ACNLHF_016513 isoform 1-T3 [Anomaloglossus baeobatrachus]|uniref:uncharacterized protein LOC142303832 n=1 Tax=Anomaloglossus baeobatrachus TaxID=238106 RepID=UPI003F4FB7DA